MKDLFLILVAAALRAGALPGWGGSGPLALLVFASLLPRVAAWERGARWWMDWAGGILFWAWSFSFLAHTQFLLPLGPAPILGLVWVLEGVLYRRLRPRLPAGLAAPLAIGAGEWLRAVFPMGGVPWSGFAAGLAGLPGMLPLSGVVGEAGLGVLVLLAAAWPLCWRRPRSRTALAVAPLCWLGAALGTLAIPSPRSLGTVRCWAVQPAVGIEEKSRNGGRFALLEEHYRLAREERERGQAPPDLLIWAETMFLLPTLDPAAEGELRIPSRESAESYRWPALDARRLMEEAVRKATHFLRPGGLFLTGAHFYQALPVDAPAEALSPRSSAALLFDRRGRLLGHGDKTRLVPFGESLPFGGHFPGGSALARWIFRNFGLLPTFRVGERPEILSLPLSAGGSWRLGTAICWENVYPEVFRRQARAGVQAYCVLSNEAWFGDGAEMDQMVAATRFRAAETGRAVIRATNTGESLVTDARGGILATYPRERAGVFVATLTRTSPDLQTPWVRGGWLFAPLWGMLGLVLALLRVGGRRNGLPGKAA